MEKRYKEIEHTRDRVNHLQSNFINYNEKLDFYENNKKNEFKTIMDQKKNIPYLNNNNSNPNPYSNTGVKNNIMSNNFSNKNNLNIGRTQNAQYGAFTQNQISQNI